MNPLKFQWFFCAKCVDLSSFINHQFIGQVKCHRIDGRLLYERTTNRYGYWKLSQKWSLIRVRRAKDCSIKNIDDFLMAQLSAQIIPSTRHFFRRPLISVFSKILRKVIATKIQLSTQFYWTTFASLQLLQRKFETRKIEIKMQHYEKSLIIMEMNGSRRRRRRRRTRRGEIFRRVVWPRFIFLQNSNYVHISIGTQVEQKIVCH